MEGINGTCLALPLQFFESPCPSRFSTKKGEEEEQRIEKRAVVAASTVSAFRSKCAK